MEGYIKSEDLRLLLGLDATDALIQVITLEVQALVRLEAINGLLYVSENTLAFTKDVVS